MSSLFAIPVDPVRLDRLPAPEPEPNEDTPTAPAAPTDLATVAAQWIERLAEVSPLEADIVELRARGCLETDLAVVFGISQAAISFRYQRGLQRLRYLVWRANLGIDEARMFDDLEVLGLDIVDQLLVTIVWETSSLIEATRRLRYASHAVMWKRWQQFVTLVTWAAELNPRFEPYAAWAAGHRWSILVDVAWPEERRDRAREAFHGSTTADTRRRIVELLDRSPGLRAQTIRTILGLSTRRWNTAVQQLLERGELQVTGRARAYRYWLA